MDNEVKEAPKTEVREEIIIDASGMPKLVRKEVPVEEPQESTSVDNQPKKKGHPLLVFLLLLLIAGGGYYYYFYVYLNNEPKEQEKEEDKTEQKTEEKLNDNDVYIYLRRDTDTILVSYTYSKAYKMVGKYTCASGKNCTEIGANKSYAVLKDNTDVILYDIDKNEYSKLDSEYADYTSCEFKEDSDGKTIGITFIKDNSLGT